jgi:CheY-like chemotaxis protein
MDGIEATRRIREHERSTGGRRLPIVAMTANVMPEARQALLEAGIDDFAYKPIVGREFAATLARWLGKAPADKEGPLSA